jgi:hypothetical protein
MQDEAQLHSVIEAHARVLCFGWDC